MKVRYNYMYSKMRLEQIKVKSDPEYKIPLPENVLIFSVIYRHFYAEPLNAEFCCGGAMMSTCRAQYVLNVLIRHCKQKYTK